MTTFELAWLAGSSALQARSTQKPAVTSRRSSDDFLKLNYGLLRLVARDVIGREWILHEGGGAITIGRRGCQDIVLENKVVSGKHAAILSLTNGAESSSFFIQDWSSKGTLLNGRRLLKQRAELKEGDCLYFGGRHFSTRLDIVQLRPLNSSFQPSIMQV
jgi:hypothetical protein